MSEELNVVMRWLHISSVAVLIGGMLYARWMMQPGLEVLAQEARDAAAEQSAARFRPFVLGAIASLLISGLYNIVTNPGHTLYYHLLLGLKLLLVAHIFAVAILAMRPGSQRRARLMAGGAISGLFVILISAYLRRIF
jgi:putative copper export protein